MKWIRWLDEIVSQITVRCSISRRNFRMPLWILCKELPALIAFESIIPSPLTCPPLSAHFNASQVKAYWLILKESFNSLILPENVSSQHFWIGKHFRIKFNALGVRHSSLVIRQANYFQREPRTQSTRFFSNCPVVDREMLPSFHY